MGRLSDKVNITPLGIKILVYLARSPEKRFYVREIAGLVKSSVGGCHRVLRSLLDQGLVEEYPSGRNLYFGINRRNPAITHLKIFVTIQMLQPLLRKLQLHCRKVILFGSCARGDDTIASDVDLLAMTADPDAVRKIVTGASVDGRSVRALVKTIHEYAALQSADPALFAEIEKGIVVLRAGDE